MPSWCLTCFYAGRDGPGEFWLREIWKVPDPATGREYSQSCYLCAQCAHFYQVPEAHPPAEMVWRDVHYGPVGVPWGRNATWDSLAVKRTQHRSEPCPLFCTLNPSVQMEDINMLKSALAAGTDAAADSSDSGTDAAAAGDSDMQSDDL